MTNQQIDLIIARIKEDLEDRRGMWPDDLENDIEAEICESWRAIIEQVIKEKL